MRNAPTRLLSASRRMQYAAALLSVGILTSACQEDQELPFNTNATSAQASVPASGGEVSLGSKASIDIPAGALTGTTQVGIAAAPTPAEATAVGTQASATSIALTPAGLDLAKPAEVQFQLAANNPNNWLASLVNVTPDTVIYQSNATIDLTSGLMTSSITTLGTVSAVIPGPGDFAILSRNGSNTVSASSTGSAAVPRWVDVYCSSKCFPSFTASGKFGPAASTAALIFPKVDAVLDFNTNGTVDLDGFVDVDAGIRVMLSGGKGVSHFEGSIRGVPTAATRVTDAPNGRFTVSNINFTVSEGGNVKNSYTGSVTFGPQHVSFSYSIVIDGVLETATVTFAPTGSGVIIGNNIAERPEGGR